MIADVTSSRSDVERQPVFLHSSFRTGSTWLWEKLRSAPTTLAYYEFFSEALADLTPGKANAVTDSTWESRHPATQPYFLEFLPLLQPAGGVAGYDQAMAFARFVPESGPDGDPGLSEQAYVRRLIEAAQSREKVPVLTCTRSLGRAAGLRRAFGGRTILLHRNLFHQWASYCSQADAANGYFFDTIRRTIAAGQHDPFLRELGTRFDVHDPSLPRAELFEVFVLTHLYLQGAAFDAADLVVDITQIATDTTVRRHCEQEMSEMIQHPLDLSDVRYICEWADTGFAGAAQVRDTIERLTKLIPTTARSAESMRFIETTQARALADWDRAEVFHRKTRSALTSRIEAVEARLQTQLAASETLRVEAEGRVADLSEALCLAASEKEALVQHLARAEADAHDLLAEREEAAARQDELERALAEAKSDLERSWHDRIRRLFSDGGRRRST